MAQNTNKLRVKWIDLWDEKSRGKQNVKIVSHIIQFSSIYPNVQLLITLSFWLYFTRLPHLWCRERSHITSAKLVSFSTLTNLPNNWSNLPSIWSITIFACSTNSSSCLLVKHRRYESNFTTSIFRIDKVELMSKRFCVNIWRNFHYSIAPMRRTYRWHQTLVCVLWARTKFRWNQTTDSPSNNNLFYLQFSNS